MNSSIPRPPTDTDTPAPPRRQDILAAALPPAGLGRHRDYDGRGMAIQPLDHLGGDDGCRRFTVR